MPLRVESKERRHLVFEVPGPEDQLQEEERREQGNQLHQGFTGDAGKVEHLSPQGVAQSDQL